MENKVFETLSKVDVKDHVEQKNGLSYLSWAWGWKYVKSIYPNASYKVLKSKAMVNGCENELNYFTDGKTAWVEVEVTIECDTQSMYLPIMDYRNRSIALENLTSFDVNKNIQRCLAKNIAVNFGLGITLYAGEDLPEEPQKDELSKINWANLTTWFTKDEIKEMYKECGVTKGSDLKNEYVEKKVDERLKAQKKESEKEFY